jgi:hypothetical protein
MKKTLQTRGVSTMEGAASERRRVKKPTKKTATGTRKKRGKERKLES